MNDPHICAQCHQRGWGCCVLGEGGGGDEAEKMFGLTRGEVAAITQATGLAAERFTVADQAPDDFLEFCQALNPVLTQAMPGGQRVRLKLKDERTCVFLGPGGCRLPARVRPLYCRLYPFWFTADDRLMVLLTDTCLAQRGAKGYRAVIERMGTSEAALRELFARLKRLAADHQAHHQARRP